MASAEGKLVRVMAANPQPRPVGNRQHEQAGEWGQKD